MSEENKIPSVDDMKKQAKEIADGIPDLKEKHKFMTQIRGNIIELSIIIEMCFNNLITATGKDLVFDYENKELHLVKGIRNKRDLLGFKTKSRDMKKLIGELFPNLKEEELSNFLNDFNKFESIRDIFAHVPVNWTSKDLEFDKDRAYKHFFKLDKNFYKVFFALAEFTNIFNWLIEIILHYNHSNLLKKEIYSQILLGKSQAEIEEEAKKYLKEKKNGTKKD